MAKSFHINLFLVAVVVLLSPGIAHASDWPMFHANIPGSEFIDDYIPPPFEISWVATLGSKIYSIPVYINDSLYIGSTDGFLYAFNASDGKVKWRGKTNRSIYSTPAVEGGLIFVGSDDGYLYAFDTDGNKRWAYPTGGPIKSSPLVKDGTVYFGSDNGYLYALYANSSLKWRRPLMESIEERVRASPAIGSNDVIYIPANVNLYAVYIQNGSLKWMKKIGYTAPLSPIFNYDKVYIISQKNGLYGPYYLRALNLHNGNFEGDDIELGDSPSFHSVTINKSVYIVYYKTLYRVENTRLIELFSRDDPLSMPIASKDMVHIGSQNGYIYTIDLNGNLKDKKQISNQDLIAGAIGDGKLYAASSDGHVYGLSSAVLIADSAIASANNSLEYADSIGADIQQAQSIFQKAKSEFSNGEFKDSIIDARESEKIAKEKMANHVKIKIANAEKPLNELKNHNNLNAKELDNLFKNALDLFAKNETKQGIEKAEYVEIFSEKILSIKDKIGKRGNFYGDAAIYDERFKSIFELLNNKSFKNALEQSEKLDLEIEKDIRRWTETYIFLVSINVIYILFIIMYYIHEKFLSVAIF